MLSSYKSIMSSLFFRTNPYFSTWLSLNSIPTWIIQKLTMLMWNMALHFKFIYNIKKLQLQQFKWNTSLCFHFGYLVKKMDSIPTYGNLKVWLSNILHISLDSFLEAPKIFNWWEVPYFSMPIFFSPFVSNFFSFSPFKNGQN